ncbi:MAG: 4-(cytidine 5'-diphospho)-2-C-methyl-D-erythritol kinase [Actinomycetaceae bacterium]|nr:4-(cytidine 5'-diphospho)-2-C-methyl-D-erythritol kinase [Actinomycetaceae bacterium]
MSVTASAPGKVNLVLWCGRQDEHGYHPLYTIFEALNLRETVTVSFARPVRDRRTVDGIGVRTVVTVADSTTNERLSDQINALDPERNLAVRAVHLVRSIARTQGKDIPPVDIDVVKRIPIAGGMAGGSADAAAALTAANELFGTGLDADDLEECGRRLGADVPACLAGGISLGLGYGDHMTRLDGTSTPTHHWVLLLAHDGLATPAVFHHFDARGMGREELPHTLLNEHENLARVDGTELAGALDNDLEQIVRTIRPDLEATFHAIERTDALGALLSGSGPTIAVAARDRDHAHSLAATLSREPSVAGTVITSGPSNPAKVENT